MSTQLLFYETAVPVSHARHGKCFVDTARDYGFTRKVNSVPLMAVEFPLAASEYAIVFARTAGEVVPVVILGARSNENLYLGADGRWTARYIPAFIRRYPFIFAASDDGKTFTLCVDEAYECVNFKGQGQALFGDDGKPTPYVDNVLKFLQEYRAQFARTQAFCKRLDELGLLEPMQAQFELGSGERMRLGGFVAVERARLKALPADRLAELVQSDEMELIYLHLQSMRNFGGVKDKLAEAQAGQGATAAGVV